MSVATTLTLSKMTIRSPDFGLRHLSKKGILLLIILLFLPFSFSIDNYISIKEKSRKKLISLNATSNDLRKPILSGDGITFLGYFERNKDSVKINLTLTSQSGDPIPNAVIYLYLNKTSGDILIGQNYTDADGNFVYTINIGNEFDLGENIITAVFPGDPFNGYGPARYFFNITVYGKLFVKLRMESKRVPLFKKNITAKVWLENDKGNKIQIAGLNFTIELFSIEANTKLYSENISSDSTGEATTIIDFYPFGEGNYTINVYFFKDRNSINYTYLLLSGETILRNGIIVGDPYSYTSDRLEVVYASKIDIYIEENNSLILSYNALKNETIKIVGRYFGPDGNPTSTKIILYVLKENSLVEKVNVTSNTTGFFETFLNLGKYGLGKITITCKDDLPETKDISNKLTIYINSILAINITYAPSYVKVGKKIYVSGIIYDEIDKTTIRGAKVEAFLQYDTNSLKLGENISDLNGVFKIANITIPTSVTSPSVNLVLKASLPPFYISSEVSTSIDIYTSIVFRLNINNSYGEWVIGEGYITTIKGIEAINLKGPGKLKIIVNTTDNYGRPFTMTYRVHINNKTLIRKTNDSGLDVLYLFINSTTEILFEVSGITITIKINISKSTLGAIRYLVYLIPILLGIIVTSILFIRGRFTKIKISKPSDIETLVEDIETLLVNKLYDEAAEKIHQLVKLLASKVGVSYHEWMTLREVLDKIYPKVEKDLYKVLETLVNVYEIIIYGHKTPANSTVNLVLKDLPKLESFSERIYE